MSWVRTHRLLASLHLCAAAIMVAVLSLGNYDWTTTDGFDPMMESGKWAMRLLLLCLLMTPLATYLGWSAAARLRKPLGLWAFGFALAHVLLYFREDLSLTRWQSSVQKPLLLLGALAMSILLALAATSNRRAMRRLGRAWKRLHRLVYLAGGAAAAHALLAAVVSKKVMARDPQSVYELRLAAALLAVALVVRIPAVRALLTPLLAPLRLRRAPVPPEAPARPEAPAVRPLRGPAPPPPAIVRPALPDEGVEEQEEELVIR